MIRRAAADALGARGRMGAVPALITATEDRDVSVRAAAAASLRRLTHRSFGFRAEAPPALRAAATERWRTWWAVEGRVDTDEIPPDDG